MLPEKCNLIQIGEMMMKSKRMICICLAMVLLTVCCMPFGAAAEETTEPNKVISYRPGDLNNDRSIRTDDARLCLRAAVGLETLTPAQTVTAQVAGESGVTSAAARQILRAAVGLEMSLDLCVYLEPDEVYELQGLMSNGLYGWCCDGDNYPDYVIVRQKSVSPGEGIIGGTYQYFTFTPVIASTYYFDFYHIGMFDDQILDRFLIRLIVAQ